MKKALLRLVLRSLRRLCPQFRSDYPPILYLSEKTPARPKEMVSRDDSFVTKAKPSLYGDGFVTPQIVYSTLTSGTDGETDVKRLCISGGSAGGYTTLAALAFRDVFKAGASLYGVADLKMLKEGHMFDPAISTIVLEVKRISMRDHQSHSWIGSCPIILFQGLEDKDSYHM